MFTFFRPVRFAEVDAARLVFFAKYAEFVHDALEALLAGLEGGYPALTAARDIGIPTVHLSIDFTAPLRYGDTARIEITVDRIGTASVTARHRVLRDSDNVECARITHTFVTARLSTLATVPVPDDMRSLLLAHMDPNASRRREME